MVDISDRSQDDPDATSIPTCVDSVIALSDHFEDIVDGLLIPPPSDSLGRFLSIRLTRPVKPKLADVLDNDDVRWDVCDAVLGDSFVRVGRRSDDS